MKMRQQTVRYAGTEYMRAVGPQRHITESYVSTPPALTITDEVGAVWCLGMSNLGIIGGEYTFDVLRNGFAVGEIANRIERRNGRVYIFGPEGRKVWTGSSFI